MQKKSLYLGLISVVLWSTAATAFKISLKYLHVYQLLFIASTVSTLVFLAVTVSNKSIGIVKQLHLKDFIYSAFLGFINPFLYYIILLKAYDILKAQEAQSLNYTWAIVLTIMSSIAFKEKIKLRKLAALIISLIGVLVIGTKGDLFSLKFDNLLGVGFALGSSVIWAGYWILTLKDTMKKDIRMLLNFGFGMVYSCILLIITNKVYFYSIKGISGGIYVGLFEMGITFFLWAKALQYAESTAKVSNLIYLSPILSFFIIQFVLREKILMSTAIGFSLIIGGILLQYIKQNQSLKISQNK